MSSDSKSLREQLLRQWNDLAKKTRELGDSLPASMFEEAPMDGVRNAGEIFRHLAFWNTWVAESAEGGSPDGAANELPKKAAPNKSRALAAFDASVADAGKALARNGKGDVGPELAALYASFLGHTAEHYGQLVVYARLEGLVPPTSR